MFQEEDWPPEPPVQMQQQLSKRKRNMDPGDIMMEKINKLKKKKKRYFQAKVEADEELERKEAELAEKDEQLQLYQQMIQKQEEEKQSNKSTWKTYAKYAALGTGLIAGGYLLGTSSTAAAAGNWVKDKITGYMDGKDYVGERATREKADMELDEQRKTNSGMYKSEINKLKEENAKIKDHYIQQTKKVKDTLASSGANKSGTPEIVMEEYKPTLGEGEMTLEEQEREAYLKKQKALFASPEFFDADEARQAEMFADFKIQNKYGVEGYAKNKVQYDKWKTDKENYGSWNLFKNTKYNLQKKMKARIAETGMGNIAKHKNRVRR